MDHTTEAVRPASQEYERTANKVFANQQADQPMAALGGEFIAEFEKTVQDRRTTELRWAEDLRQYKGQYSAETLANIGANRSKSFVRKTRVKVKTVDSRVGDLLFPAGNDKNWNIEPTPVPSVDPQQRAEVRAALQQQQMAAAAQMAMAQPGPVSPEAGTPQTPQLPPIDDKMVDAVITEKVKVAAREMSKQIDDQLVEARYKQQALMVIHSGHLYGTGVLKGPLVERRVRTRFKAVPVMDAMGQATGQSNWQPYSERYVVPFVDYVPLWRFYPDMSATSLDQCRFIFERHIMTGTQVYALIDNPSFNKPVICSYLEAHPHGFVKVREHDQTIKEIGDRETKVSDTEGQYEVLERWGYVTGSKLSSVGVLVASDRMQESFFCNVWMFPCGTVIKAVLQPIDGTTWPYHLYYFDKDETSIFGEGLSSIMRDDQEMINAGTRMILDNGAITSGPMLEIVVDLLASGENPDDIRPWRTFKRKAADINKGPAVRAIEIPNHLEDLQRIVQQFDTNADESTAIPRYVTGENATNGAAGTASGMSMLMGAVNIVIKDLITGYDEGITVPFLQALYHWNMKFNPRQDIKGDFDVYARGNASLVAKEVRARQLNEFGQLTLNPEDMKYIHRHKLMQQRAEALEMSDIIKTEDDVKADNESEQAKTAAAMTLQMQQAQLAEQQAKVGKLTSDAALANKRAEESAAQAKLLTARLEETAANIDKIIAETVSKRVETVFAALQAGGVATSRPTIAPAGDEILKSSGFVDVNGDPSIATLNGPPIQAQQGTQALMNRGQTFAEEPRGDAPMPPDMAAQAMLAAEGANQANDVNPALADVSPLDAPPSPDQITPNPQTGMVGRRAGMLTDEIESPPA